MVKIYYLLDPETNQVRYIGKTISTLRDRLYSHISNTKIKTHKSDWIKSLKNRGLRPLIELIDEVSDDKWADEERFYISYLRFVGCDLVNMSEGGEPDNTGKRFSEETRMKMSKSQIGKKHLQASRDSMSKSKMGEGSYSAKLTWADVAEIRGKYLPHKYSAPKLAREYNVSTSSIRDILAKKTWRSV